MKVFDIVNEYIETKKHGVKLRTYLFYKQQSNTYIKDNIGEIDIKVLLQDDVDNFIIGLYENGSKKTGEKLSYSTVKGIDGLLNRSLKYAYKKGYISQQIKSDVCLKQNSNKKIEALTKDEQKKIENYILSKKRCYNYGVLISLYTGMRLGELLVLKWSDIDYKNKLIHVQRTTCRVMGDNSKTVIIEDTPKSKSSIRDLPLTNFLISLLKELKKFQNNNSEYVVSRAVGKRIENRSYQESFDRLLKRLNIRHYGFHSLRHTFATRSLEIGIDIKTLSELMGHSNPTITLNRYVHSDLNMKKDAMDKLSKVMNKIAQ